MLFHGANHSVKISYSFSKNPFVFTKNLQKVHKFLFFTKLICLFLNSGTLLNSSKIYLQYIALLRFLYVIAFFRLMLFVFI